MYNNFHLFQAPISVELDGLWTQIPNLLSGILWQSSEERKGNQYGLIFY